MRPIAKYYAILGKTTFSPLDLSPALWLDASDTSTITASSGAVSEWRDKSGNARHVSQGTAASQPTTGTATINGLNVLSFDGGDALLGGTWSLAQPLTIVMVFRTGFSQVTYAMLFDGNASGLGDRAILFARREDFGFASTMYSTSNADTGALAANTTYAWAATFNGASSSSRRNGSTTSVSIGTTGIVNGAQISSTATPTVPFTGTIAEVIVVGSALNAQQLTDLSTYISNKWGVTL